MLSLRFRPVPLRLYGEVGSARRQPRLLLFSGAKPHHNDERRAAHDPLCEAAFTAKINGKQATIKRFNANSYEIKGAGYVLSIALDEDGITDASWNKTHGRDHGLLQFTQK